MERATPRGSARSRLIRACLLLCSLAPLGQNLAASPLSKVVEEAKKPVAEQEVLQREASCIAQTQSQADDDDAGLLGIFGNVLSFLDDLFWSRDAEASPSTISMQMNVTGGGTSSANSFAQPENFGRPPRPEPRFYLGTKSLSVRPHDHVLGSLDGVGGELGGFFFSKLQLGAGLYWMRGEVRHTSPARNSITNLQEFALDVRARLPLLRGQVSGLTAFAGVRVADLRWDYVNSVYAVDPSGRGDEIFDDLLHNVTGYFGVGLVPVRTGSMYLGADLGVGWRGYSSHSFEGFPNDLFADGWMAQLNIEVVLTF